MTVSESKSISKSNLKIVVFALMFTIIGYFFAFLTEQNWENIQYSTMKLPFPFPSGLFYTICILAYLLQGVCIGIIFKHSRKLFYDISLMFFWAQFCLVILWLLLFFEFHFFGTALFELITASILLTFTFASFKKVNLIAAYLLLPYGGLIIMSIAFNVWFFLV